MASEQDPAITITLLGDSVGKTALIDRYVHSAFHNAYTATIGSGFTMKSTLYGWIRIVDTAGQQKLSCLGYGDVELSDGCMLCYDVTSATSFDNVKQLYEHVMEQSPHKDFCFLLVGCKSDELSRVVGKHDAAEWASAQGMKFCETSSRRNKNVTKVFERLMQTVIARHPPQYTMHEVTSHNTRRDLWVVIENKVYNLTTFVGDHPGGADVLVQHAGTDATVAFRGIEHSRKAKNDMKHYQIGVLFEVDARTDDGGSDSSDYVDLFVDTWTRRFSGSSSSTIDDLVDKGVPPARGDERAGSPDFVDHFVGSMSKMFSFSAEEKNMEQQSDPPSRRERTGSGDFMDQLMDSMSHAFESSDGTSFVNRFKSSFAFGHGEEKKESE